MYDKVYVVEDYITNKPRMAFGDRGEAVACAAALCRAEDAEGLVSEVPLARPQRAAGPADALSLVIALEEGGDE